MSSQTKKVQMLFQKVIAMETIAAYDFLSASEEDPEIIKQVISLLSDSNTRTQFLTEHPDLHSLIPLFSENENLVGATVGSFKLLELLGKGGMGEVYLGEDTQLQRQVAVKTIRGVYRLNPKTRDRFRREALILSKLNHENICKIFHILEVGEVDFLVLEFIEGKTLNKYTLHEKSHADKLNLAKALLSGLDAAHQESIVHRDIKPDNIIITKDGDLKILDFGISASLSPVQFADTNTDNNRKNSPKEQPDNNSDVILGTLGYMSPEQANGQEISTASDIYSAGIILHELFSNQAAHPKDLEPQVLLKRGKKGQTEPLQKTSNDLTLLINRMKSLKPASRPTALDAISMLDKIAEKPKRRLKQFAALTILLTSFLAFTKYTYDLNQQRIKADVAKTEALSSKDESEKITQFLESLFEVSNPYSSQGKEITARQILDDGAERINEELKNQPVPLTRMKIKIGKIYVKLGLFESARSQLKDALYVIEKSNTDNPELHAQAISQFVELEFEASNYQSMFSLASQGINILEENQLTDSEIYLPLKFNLAAATNEIGQHKQALTAFNDLLQIYNKQPDKYLIERVTTYNYIGLINADNSQFENAKDNLEIALSLIEHKDNYIEYKLSLYGNLGTIYEDLGQYEKALELGLKTAQTRIEVLGDMHPHVALTYYNISEVYCAMDDLEKCKAYNEKALKIYEQTNKTTLVEYPKALGFKAALLDRSAETEKEAELIWIKSIQLFTEILGEDHLFIANHLVSLGINYINQKKYELATEKTQEAISMYQKLDYPLRGDHLNAMKNLGYISKKQNNKHQQLKIYNEILQTLNQETKPDQALIQSIRTLITESEVD